MACLALSWPDALMHQAATFHRVAASQTSAVVQPKSLHSWACRMRAEVVTMPDLGQKAEIQSASAPPQLHENITRKSLDHLPVMTLDIFLQINPQCTCPSKLFQSHCHVGCLQPPASA